MKLFLFWSVSRSTPAKDVVFKQLMALKKKKKRKTTETDLKDILLSDDWDVFKSGKEDRSGELFLRKIILKEIMYV